MEVWTCFVKHVNGNVNRPVVKIKKKQECSCMLKINFMAKPCTCGFVPMNVRPFAIKYFSFD